MHPLVRQRPLTFRRLCPHLRVAVLACALAGAPTLSCADSSVEAPVRIHVIGNGWHAGLLLPAGPINALVPSLRERFPEAENYEIGWGDMGFYQASEITVGLALQALFASKGALLHVVGVSGSVQAFVHGRDVAETCLSADGLQRMAQMIAQTFVKDEEGRPQQLGFGLYGDSQFYKATGRYSLFYTCNRWTAEVLATGGLSISPRFSLTAGSVLGAVKQASGTLCQPVAASASRLSRPIIWRATTSLSASGPKGLLR